MSDPSTNTTTNSPSPTLSNSSEIPSINQHSGNKYVRKIISVWSSKYTIGTADIDVYAVLEAFDVRCPARQHAIKKLLCAGLRGKASQIKDLKEAIDATYRAVELQEIRENDLD